MPWPPQPSEYLQLVTDVAALKAAPVAQVFHGVKCANTNTTVASGNFPPAALALTTESFDTDAFHDLAVNTSRFTIPTGLGGRYLIGGTIYWGNTGTGGSRALFWGLNGSLFSNTGFRTNAPATNNDAISSFADLVTLAAGDYVEIFPYQETGGNLTGCNVTFWLDKRS